MAKQEIKEFTVKQLKEYANERGIQIPSGLVREDLIIYLKMIKKRRRTRMKNPFIINPDILYTKPYIETLKLIREYYAIAIDRKDPIYNSNETIRLGIQLELIKPRDEPMDIPSMYQNIKDLVDISIQSNQTAQGIRLVTQSKKDTKAVCMDEETMDKHMIRGVPVTYRQVRDYLSKSQHSPDVYKRWEFMTDKQAMVNFIYQVLSKAQDGVQLTRLINGFKIQGCITNHFRSFLNSILEKSTHTFLSNKYVFNSPIQYMIRSLSQTATDLYEVGPNTTVKNTGQTFLMDPRDMTRPLKWDDFLAMVCLFIKKLPVPLQVNWAESYMTAFIEGYDLKVCSFPRQVLVFGRSLHDGTHEYPSCYLGMLYHTFISLYDILFECYIPPVQEESKEEREERERIIAREQHVSRVKMINQQLSDFQNEYLSEQDMKENELFTPEQKEHFRQLFTARILSYDFSNDGYDWIPLINEALDAVVDYLGKKRRKSNKRKSNKRKSNKRKSNKRKSRRMKL